MHKKILVYRFSSFGDVLLTLPVFQGLNQHWPDMHITLLTRSTFVPYFQDQKNLTVIGVDFLEYQGLPGLINLFRHIRKHGPYDAVIDLHQVIRSKVLNGLFRITGSRVITIVKPRQQRKLVLQHTKNAKVIPALDMYRQAFRKAGLDFSIEKPSNPAKSKRQPHDSSGSFRIGLAPFARHATKTWPLDHFIELKKRLEQTFKAEIYFFCSPDESRILLKQLGDQCRFASPDGQADQEIRVIRQLDLMISLDSANMHLADIHGIPVLSIWGGTHPDAGFKPYFQPEHHQLASPDHFPCRPCSIYGRADCHLKSNPFGCLTSISVNQVFEAVQRILR